MAKIKVTEEQQELIEKELRRGTNKSRISTLLDVDYDTGIEMIDYVKEDIRPDVGDRITFKFRDSDMAGTIIKLLTNSAVIDIYWELSDPSMKDITEDRTIVNFKDIIDFVEEPED
ncbi:DUF2187 family protein [Aerococcaceae bacterium DSM 111020]|nr:DUF2187 family protein [Aerococcaceae bacterium DSM 111020]